MIIAVLVVFGLCLGSFVNALVWRLRMQAEAVSDATQTSKRLSKESIAKQKQITADDLSIMKGRSMCPHCNHTLAPHDLVPVVSWLTLAGKCRYCRAPIGWQYPLVELATVVIFVLSYLWWPIALDARGIFDLVVWLLVVVCFMALAVYDFRWFELPDKIILPLTVLVTVQTIVDAFVFNGGWHELVGRAVALLIIGGLFMGLYVLSEGKWIGFGDVKIAPALGLLAASPYSSLLVIFLASLLGTIAALPLLVKGSANRNSHIPFGPFLIAATAIVVLFGDKIINAYLGLMLLN